MNRKESKVRDGFDSRLLLYIKKLTERPFDRMERIKKGVWILTSHQEIWIVKEFPSPHNLEKQMKLTRSLQDSGFLNTYTFHPIHDRKLLQCEDRYFGILEYIEPDKVAFHYSNNADRRDGLALLSRFHQKTESWDGLDEFPQAGILQKWEKRLQMMMNTSRLFRSTEIYSYLMRYIMLGETSLSLMRSRRMYYEDGRRCVLHGDVAHHNFIRSRYRKLYLIDFDLISAGPKQIDLIQFCVRILPSLGWSLTKLEELGKPVSHFIEEKDFLYALLYPSDIFREWNHLAAKGQASKKKQQYLLEMTVTQFTARMEFVRDLIKRIEK